MGFFRQHIQERQEIPGFSVLAGKFWLWGLFALLGLVWTGLVVLYPLYQEAGRLEAEKEAWQEAPVQSESTRALVAEIPTLEQLPEVLEVCRLVFLEEGIVVNSLNVERIVADSGASPSVSSSGTSSAARIGSDIEERGAAPNALLDFARVRLRWQGPWAGIEQGLARLETYNKFRILVQEVSLKPGGGEGTLQIYFRAFEP